MNAIVEFPIFDARTSYETIQLELARDLNALFSWMKPTGRACFSSAMVHEIAGFESMLETHQGNVYDGAAHAKVDYVVFGSRTPGVYNLGGDLEMFVSAILMRDRKKIEYYAKLCMDCAYRRYTGFGAGLTTIALVQGKALGGGFESALACNYIVAERSATFALPEVLFNLFPGMGAMSFLSRRVGLSKAEEICLSGETYSAREMHAMGVIDQLVDDGEGVTAVRDFIARRSRHPKAHRAIARARALVDPISRGELDEIIQVWTDAAMALEAKDLRMMGRLVRAQDRLNDALRADDDAESFTVEPRLAMAVNA
jgi:DSF synthase